ncbi:MAG: glycosyltransferase family 2 protein [Sulfolobales archaeon]
MEWMVLGFFYLLVVFANIAHMSYNYKILLRSERILSTGGEEDRRINIRRSFIVISPCKIASMRVEELEDFMRTLRRILDLDLISRVIIVVDSERDEVMLRMFTDSSDRRLEILRASEDACRKCSGKNRAIITALEKISGVSSRDLLLFIDCDADFIRFDRCVESLEKVMKENKNAIATGYRWYYMDSMCSTAFNLVSTLYFEALLSERTRIVWGGLMCGEADLFYRYDVSRELSREIADDATIRRVFTRNKAGIIFTPYCIGFTRAPCRSRWVDDFVLWSARQLLMIRIYTPRGFFYVLIGYAIIVVLMISPLIALLLGVSSKWISLLIFLSLSLYFIGVLRGFLLLRFMSRIWGSDKLYNRARYMILYLMISGVRAFLALYLLIETLRMRRFSWRGSEYCVVREEDGLKALPCSL